MNAVTVKNWVIAVAAVIALYILFRLYLWVSEKGASGAAKDAAGFAADVVGGLLTGSVEGVSRSVGIPKTNADKCAADRTAGKWLDASFSCDAGTFTKSLFNRVFSTEPLKNQFKDVQSGSSTTAVSVKDFSSVDSKGNIAW